MIDKNLCFSYLNGVADGLNESRKNIIEELEKIKTEIENIDLVYEKNGRTTIMKNFDDIKSEIFDILDKHIKDNK